MRCVVEQPSIEQFGDDGIDPRCRFATVAIVEADGTLDPPHQNIAQIGRRGRIAIEMRQRRFFQPRCGRRPGMAPFFLVAGLVSRHVSLLSSLPGVDGLHKYRALHTESTKA